MRISRIEALLVLCALFLFLLNAHFYFGWD
jgi:hypothetical protein